MAPNGIREIVDLARGRDEIVRLEVGEPGFATPAHIVKAACASAQGMLGYTDSAGILPLREAVTAKAQRLHGLAVPPDRVVVGLGAVQVCALVFTALLDEGDEVLIPDPSWPNYEMLVTALGGHPVRYPLRPETGFVPDPDEVATLVTERCRVIVVNTPSNPTGVVFSPEIVAAFVELARRRGAVLLSDEVYDELIFDGAPANAAALDDEHVVGVYSLSKTYAMTGWRVGYALAPGWLAPTMRKLQSPMLASIPGVSQYAAVRALTGPQDCVAEMRAAYQRNRDLAVAGLRDGGVPVHTPAGAFYVMVALAKGTDSRQAAFDLIDHGVAVAPGTAFGAVARDHWRLSLAATREDLEQGVGRIVEWYRRQEGGARLAGTQGTWTRA